MARDRDSEPPASLADSLANLVGDIVSDAREKIVEEGWFGRSTTNQLPNYYESLWQRYGHPRDEIAQERKDSGIDIER